MSRHLIKYWWLEVLWTYIQKLLWIGAALIAAKLLLHWGIAQAQELHQPAIIMIPANLSPSGEPLGFEGVCEPSRVYAPALECRATAKGDN